MSDLKLTGRITYIGEQVFISEKFSKREFAIEVETVSNSGQTFSNAAAFQFVNNQCTALNNFQIGQEVEVSFNVRTNRNDKDGVVRFFTNLQAWRIGLVGQQQTQQPQRQQAAPPKPAVQTPAQATAAYVVDSDDDSLPF